MELWRDTVTPNIVIGNGIRRYSQQILDSRSNPADMTNQAKPSRVIVDAVVNEGVTPFPATILGVTVPDQSIAEAPPPDLPVDQCVIVVGPPPVPAGNVMVLTGDMLPPVSVHPPVVRATLTRA